MKKTQKKMTVLITGAGSGIGKAVAEYFLKNGHTVYGVDIRFPEDVGGMCAFTGDITCPQDMERIKTALQEQNAVLDWVLNFAGVHTMASFIEEEYEKIRRVAEINLLGAVLVNKTFHSLLKKDGKILITTSEVAPLAPLPFNGIYSVTKTALDAYAQALRQELNLLGQRVVTLRPGAIQTPLARGSADATVKLCENTKLYKKESVHFSRIVKRFTGTPMPAEKLARLVYKIAGKKRPKYVYSKHRNAGLVLLGALPKSWQCFIVKKLVQRKGKNKNHS